MMKNNKNIKSESSEVYTCSLINSSECLLTVPLVPTKKAFGQLKCIVEFLLKCNLNIISDYQLARMQDIMYKQNK